MTASNSIMITHTESNHKGLYSARLEGVAEAAELTYSRMNDSTVIADHTSVPEVMRGRGVGLALVEYFINDARARHFRIVPLCPYVKAQFVRHPQWADVMTD